LYGFAVGIQGATKVKRMKISAATAAVILRGGISPFIKAKRVDNNVLTRCSTCIDVDMFNKQKWYQA